MEMRPVTDDEYPVFSRAVGAGFGEHPSDEEIARWGALKELDRSIAVFDEQQIVATAGGYTFELTLPGRRTIPVAGVTAVTVRPTHRRRGLLRQMMAAQLDDVAGRGEAIAVLTASESGIYGRFGYGQASWYHSWTLATEGTAVARPSTAKGRVRIVEADEAARLLPAVYERARMRHPGQLSISDARWAAILADPPGDRDGATALFFAVHEDDDGVADGFVAYRRSDRWEHNLPDGVLIVGAHLDAVDDEAEAALWDFLLEIDLVRTVRATARPVDEPLRWRLADPRRVLVGHVGDHLWVRIVDVAAALAARRYGTDDRLVLELVDPFRPANDGRWFVEGGADGAAAGRTDAAADLRLAVPDLGSIYLGGLAPSVLARTGRVEELRPGALRRADAFFRSERAPWCAVEF